MWNKVVWILNLCIAKLAGAVEYTDCTTARWVRPPTNEGPDNDIKRSDG